MYCYHCMTKLEEGDAHCYRCGHSTAPELIPHHLRQGTALNNKYLIGDAIGEGGFGITYIGLDLTLDLRIAVKEYFPNGYANRDNRIDNRVFLNSGDDAFRHGKEQFLREAQSIAKFSKEDGIVDVRDYFTENETAYIVMEYLEGDTLAQHLRKNGRMEAKTIFTLLLPVMRSLEKMHNKGIIHRDISPDNIMFTDDHRIRLMDFGSARYFTGAEKRTMSVMLKPGYAPYEQYSTQGDQGPWTDVYGLCATIYKCITGKTPVDSLSRCKADELKKPSELGAAISPALEAVLLYGLAVFPDSRCRSMKELIGMTEKALQNDYARPDIPGPERRYQTVPANDPGMGVYRREPYAENRSDDRGDRFYRGDRYPADDRYRGKERNCGGYAAEPPAPVQRYEPPKKNRTGWIVAFIVIGMLALGGLVAFLLFHGLEGMDRVVVADVSGKAMNDAAQQLENDGLKVELLLEENNDVAEGTVIRQSVASGSELKRGDTVTLYISGSESSEIVEADEGTSSPIFSHRTLYNSLCKEFVTLRSSTSTKASAITKIPKDATVELLAFVQDSEFIKVSYDGKTGYALMAFFTEDSDPGDRYVMYCDSKSAVLRSQPGEDDGDNIEAIPNDSPVQCTGKSETVGDTTYLQVYYKDKLGYVAEDKLSETM